MNALTPTSDLDVVALRARLGWTQAQLADHLGVERSTVSRWEGGSPIKGPARRMLETLAQDSKTTEAAE